MATFKEIIKEAKNKVFVISTNITGSKRHIETDGKYVKMYGVDKKQTHALSNLAFNVPQNIETGTRRLNKYVNAIVLNAYKKSDDINKFKREVEKKLYLPTNSF